MVKNHARDNWMSRNFRTAHVLYVSPDWVPDKGAEFDIEDFVDRLKTARAKCIEFYAKDFWGISYYQTQIGHYYGRDLLRPLIEACHQADLKFIAYYCIYWDKFVWQHYPQWRAPGWMTIPKKDSGIIWPVSMDSGYKDYVYGQLEEIARDYEIDGMWLDMPAGNLIEMTSLIKKYRPQALVTWNNDLTPQAVAAWKNRHEDFLSVEAHGPDYLNQSLIARLLRRAGKPFEITSPGTTQYWGGWSPKPVNMLKVEAAVVMANGGQLTVGLNPYPQGRVEPAEIENLGELWRWIEPREEYLINTQSCADVGVFACQSPEGLNATLVENHIQFAYLNEKDDLGRYRLLILPEGIELPSEQIRDYVASGGKVLAFYKNYRGLEDVLGVKALGEIPYTGCYARLTHPDITKSIIDYPLLLRDGKAVKCECAGGESFGSIVYPLAELSESTYVGFDAYNPPGEQSPYPMIVHHNFDKGETLYVAATVAAELQRTYQSGSPWLKQLMANMIRCLVPDPVIETNAPPGVEVVLNRQRDRYILHVINKYSAMAGTYSLANNGPKIADIEVTVNIARIGTRENIYLAPESSKLNWSIENNRLKIKLNRLDINAIIVIE